jgi:hypothetical protein
MYLTRLSRRAIPSTGAIAAIVLLAAGCGGSSPTTTTNSDSAANNSPAPKDVAAAAYRYSTCMRDHGVTNFPDPKVHESSNGGSTQVAVMIPAGVGTNSPQFKSAQTACRGILPQPSKSDLAQQAHDQQVHKEDLLAFTRCLRDHGVNGFPDPNSQGELSLQQVRAAGIDLQAPSVRTAALTCVPTSNGSITRADVMQATSANPPQGGSGDSQAQGTTSSP